MFRCILNLGGLRACSKPFSKRLMVRRIHHDINENGKKLGCLLTGESRETYSEKNGEVCEWDFF